MVIDLESLQRALEVLFSWQGIWIPICGTLLAMGASFLPGIGNASMAAMLLVLTVDWTKQDVLLLFGAMTGGATFMGSVTAILFNVPGSAASTPALFDGFPLSEKGYPMTALATAASASAVGSVLGVFLLLMVLPLAEQMLYLIGPLEIALACLLGLFSVVSVTGNAYGRGLVMMFLGLVTALIGTDRLTGVPRLTIGNLELYDGLSVIAAMLGVFTISEILTWNQAQRLGNGQRQRRAREDSFRHGIRHVWQHRWLVSRSSLIGTLIGMVPGLGGTVAGFIAYDQARRSSPAPNRFGNGDIRGLIAPEAAVDAKDGGTLVPTLLFGLPGSEACVILLAVFTMHGIVPGPALLTEQRPLVYLLVTALLFSNLLTSVVGLASATYLARIRRIPLQWLAPPCLAICLVAVSLHTEPVTAATTMLAIGVFCYFCKRNEWPRIPFAIGFLLGPTLEKQLVISAQLINAGRLELSASIAVGMLCGLAILLIGWKVVGRSNQTREIRVALPTMSRSTGIAALGVLLAVMVNIDLWSINIGRYGHFLAITTLVVVFSVFVLQLRSRVSGERWFADLIPCPADRGALAISGISILLLGVIGITATLTIALICWLFWTPLRDEWSTSTRIRWALVIAALGTVKVFLDGSIDSSIIHFGDDPDRLR